MLQGLCSPSPIPRPDPFGLPITPLQQLAGFSQPQVARLHSPHHLHPTQLLAAQSRPPQSVYLLSEALNGDISNVVARGHFYCGSTCKVGVVLFGKNCRPPRALSCSVRATWSRDLRNDRSLHAHPTDGQLFSFSSGALDSHRYIFPAARRSTRAGAF